MTLRRRKPIAKKRTTPRRKAATCSIGRCNSRPSVLGLCKSHAIRRADKVVGDFVKARDKVCQAEGEHKGPLQWAHIVSRRYRAIRWDANNAVVLCAGHHMGFTGNPLKWDEWVEKRIGVEAYAELKRRALHDALPDLTWVISDGGR